MKFLRVLTLVALVAPGVALAGDPPQNDGGTGGDASNDASSPTLLPAYGLYEGSVRSKGQDWFGVPDLQAGPVCLTLAAGGDTFSNVTLLARRDNLSHGVVVPLPSGGTTGLVVASGRLDITVMGILPVPNPASNDPARPGSYSLDVARRTLADLPLSDEHGFLRMEEPMPLPQSPCVAGKLDPMRGFGDVRDAYEFAAHAGEQVVYSLGALGGPVTMRIEDTMGQVLSMEIGSGEIGTFTFPENGTYELVVVASADASQTDYVAGVLGLEWPPSNPCRPHCLTIQES